MLDLAFFIERQSSPYFPVVDTGDAYDLERRIIANRTLTAGWG